ncbi:hypothetical protein TRFO_40846 [Tritrichomonas foetus]|uniref:Uncharacterized protein n=1 Tax=Tritrichomonas foetus TaxID=1144522 RepID=A0A1J4IZP7_9EUKA|nr:hypothetical protein TRFO_40846 [Tritrichomonas foetus]|eukprot:OHS92824.1 hypothetical protein TRFO_40846 [Tritrichomonas foetus]
MDNYKSNLLNDGNKQLNFLRNSEDTNQENPKTINVEKYNSFITQIKKETQKNDYVEVYFYLKKFLSIFSHKEIATNDILFSELALALASYLEFHITNKTTEYAPQELINTIFHTFNLMLTHNTNAVVISQLFEIFQKTKLYQIIPLILQNSNQEVTSELFKFLCLICYQNEECMKYVFSIVSDEKIHNLIVSEETSPKLFEDASNLIQIVALYHINDSNFNDKFYEYMLFFLSFSNIIAIRNGYQILNNLTKNCPQKMREIVPNSIELIHKVERHLSTETISDILQPLITVLGMMCMHGYDLHLYPLLNLIQFLEHENASVRMLAAFAICNALTTNKSNFPEESHLQIFYIMMKIVNDDKYNVKSFFSQTLPKVFTILPVSVYPKLVDDNIFDTFQKIAMDDQIMKTNDCLLLLRAIDSLFQATDTLGTFDQFSHSFEETGCLDTILQTEFNDPATTQAIDCFMEKYTSRKHSL